MEPKPIVELHTFWANTQQLFAVCSLKIASRLRVISSHFVCLGSLFTMSSDLELSESFDSASSIASEDSEEEWGVIDTEISPYQDEPLATDGATDEDNGDSEDERDVDGLTPAILEQRYESYERTVDVHSWLVKFLELPYSIVEE